MLNLAEETFDFLPLQLTKLLLNFLPLDNGADFSFNYFNFFYKYIHNFYFDFNSFRLHRIFCWEIVGLTINNNK